MKFIMYKKDTIIMLAQTTHTRFIIYSEEYNMLSNLCQFPSKYFIIILILINITLKVNTKICIIYTV